MLALNRSSSILARPFGEEPGGQDPKIVADGPMKGLDLVDVKKDNVKPYLRRALHVDIRAKRQENAVLAMTDPKKWLDERKKEIDTMTDAVADLYAKQLKIYYNNGYTGEESIEKATDDANALYERMLRELEANFPGGEAFLGQPTGSAKIDESKYRKLKEKYKKMKANKVTA